MEINSKSVILAPKGGEVTAAVDGEIVGIFAVQPGQTVARDILALVPPGADLHLSKGVTILERRSWFGRQRVSAGNDSGANPDYRPTSADRLQREMRMTLNRVKASEKRLEARLSALDGVDRVPTKAPKKGEGDDPAKGTKEAPAEVIEDDGAAVE
jgi:hypothetical protein